MTITTVFITVPLIILMFWWATKKPIPNKGVGLQFSPSKFRFTVYKANKDSLQHTEMILEGNQVDDLGYQIYKDYRDNLDTVDILIRRNETGELWKIVKDGDEESMIGVNHPQKGHIGYLPFETVTY